jgi:hypothetical protein
MSGRRLIICRWCGGAIEPNAARYSIRVVGVWVAHFHPRCGELLIQNPAMDSYLRLLSYKENVQRLRAAVKMPKARRSLDVLKWAP